MKKKLRIILLVALGAVAAAFVWVVTVPRAAEGSFYDSSWPRDMDEFIYGIKSALGLAPRNRSALSSCIANLKQIDGAKATWALENKRVNSDVPSATELYGATGYIRDRPLCPQGGGYLTRSVAEKPTCTIPGHTL